MGRIVLSSNTGCLQQHFFSSAAWEPRDPEWHSGFPVKPMLLGTALELGLVLGHREVTDQDLRDKRKSSENAFSWDVKKSALGVGGRTTLRQPEKPVVTKKTPILKSLYGGIWDCLSLMGEGGWWDHAVPCRGCLQSCGCSAWRGNSLEQRNPGAEPSQAAALPTSAPGHSPAHTITWALPNSGVSCKRHPGTILSRDGNQTLGWTSPVCRPSLFSRLLPAWWQLGFFHCLGKSPAPLGSTTPAGFSYSCCFLSASNASCSQVTSSFTFWYELFWAFGGIHITPTSASLECMNGYHTDGTGGPLSSFAIWQLKQEGLNLFQVWF